MSVYRMRISLAPASEAQRAAIANIRALIREATVEAGIDPEAKFYYDRFPPGYARVEATPADWPYAITVEATASDEQVARFKAAVDRLFGPDKPPVDGREG